MPIHWTISHPTRLVVAVCKDVVSRTDIEAYLDGVVVGDAMSYRKIFELREALSGLDDDDMMALGARIQAYASLPEPMGPLAIVALTDEQHEYARRYAVLATARRPVKIFRELHLARHWLDSLEKKESKA
jgi:hypothetical protein